jgi:hypothetical protein
MCCNHNEPHNLDPHTPVQEQSIEQGRSAMNWSAVFQEKQTGVVWAIIELGAMQC